MRLIDADALWMEFNNASWYRNADQYEIALPLIDAAPTIDPASLRPKGEWISVMNELPTRDGEYLCCYVFENENRQFFGVLDYYSFDEIPHFQHELIGYGMRVTHWMPMPEPPNAGGAPHDR